MDRAVRVVDLGSCVWTTIVLETPCGGFEFPLGGEGCVGMLGMTWVGCVGLLQITWVGGGVP